MNEVIWTAISTLGGLVTIIFSLYRFGIRPQMKDQQEFFKKKFEDLKENIQSVKNAVDNNTETLSQHGERIASLETQVRMINGNPGDSEEE